MEFTFKEMVAVFKMAKAMVFADGKIEKKEMELIMNEYRNFGAEFQALQIQEAGDNMQSSEAFAVLSAMDEQKKKYVCAFLGTICIVDGNVDEKEASLWSFVSFMAGFPTMSIAEAIDYWSKN